MLLYQELMLKCDCTVYVLLIPLLFKYSDFLSSLLCFVRKVAKRTSWVRIK